MSLYDLLKFLHVITAVFMAAPLYNLIVVNERVKFGKASLDVDRYFENIIKGNAIRCYVFQLTALVTGVLLAVLGGASPLANWVVLTKLLILFVLVGMLSTVHFAIQPRIDRLLALATADPSAALPAGVGPLRLKRKRLAALCLFLVIVAVLLGLQVYARFGAPLSVLLGALAATFSWWTYRTRIPYGWI